MVDSSPVTDQASLYATGDERSVTPTPPPDYITKQALNALPRNYDEFWLSARTIRAALAQQAVLRGKMTEEDVTKLIAQPQENYQILVRGPRLELF